MWHIVGSQRRSYSRLLLLVGLLLLISLLPFHQQVSANTPQTQALDTTLSDFTRGTFERTALTPAGGDGGVELARIGTLNDWQNMPPSLPELLTQEGAVGLGNRLYVLAGSKATGGSASEVYWLQIDQEQGAPPAEAAQWQSVDPLPAYASSDYITCDFPVAEVAEAATVAVETDVNTGSGYIYVIGGRVAPPACSADGDVSSNIARIGTVNGSTGAVTWSSETSTLPQGLHAAAATTVRTTSGRTFIYVFGGREFRYSDFTGTVQSESKQVYYAEVNLSNGTLSEWQTATDDIPVAENGLWDATAIAVASENIGNNIAGRGVYLAGGVTAQDPDSGRLTYNANVYLARIAGDGTISWEERPGEGDRQVGLAGILGLSGIMANNKLYLIAGERESPGSRFVLTAVLNDDLTLYNVGTETQARFFDETSEVLPAGRIYHATALIRAKPKVGELDPSSAYVYVVAGTGNGSATDTVFRGDLGGQNETADGALVPNGWYYSTYHTANLDNARIRQFSWKTIMDEGSPMDLQLEYRVTNNLCNAPNPFNNSSWQPLDGAPGDADVSSVDGTNIHSFQDRNQDEPTEVNCIQYRARFIKGASNSPALLEVSVDILASGNPDLTISQLAATYGDDGETFTGLDITIRNHNDQGTPAAVSAVSPGSFYVDLCILNSGETVPSQFGETPLNLGQTPPGCIKAYAVVNSGSMGVDVEYTITRRWFYPRTDGPDEPLLSLKEMEVFFPTAGVYTVVVAVDSTNFVPELATGGEANNVDQLEVVLYPDPEADPVEDPNDPGNPKQPPKIEIPPDPVGPMIYLPLIAK
jgi:hypothetical protein